MTSKVLFNREDFSLLGECLGFFLCSGALETEVFQSAPLRLASLMEIGCCLYAALSVQL